MKIKEAIKCYSGKRIRKNMYLRPGYYITFRDPGEFDLGAIFLLHLKELNERFEAYWEEVELYPDTSNLKDNIEKAFEYLKNNIKNKNYVDSYPLYTKFIDFMIEYDSNEKYYEYNTLSIILKKL